MNYRLLIAILLFLPFSMVGQIPPKIPLINYGTSQGLSQTSGLTIVQDQSGFLWVGTYDGLNRFDGYEFKAFKYDPEDTTTISHNDVRSIVVDEDDNLWIGTYGGGLNYFNRETQSFERFSYEGKRLLVEQIIQDSKGRIWLSTYRDGVKIFDPGTRTFIPNPDEFEGRFEIVYSVLEDREGNFWIGHSNGLTRWNSQDKELTDIDLRMRNNVVSSLMQDELGDIWVGMIVGLARLSPSGKIIKEYRYDQHDKRTISPSTVLYTIQDTRGNIWVGTNGGLSVYNSASDDFTRINDGKEDNPSFSSQVFSIMEDRQQNIWIGTLESGLYKLDPDQLVFKGLSQNDKEAPINSPAIFSILEDQNKDVWIGTFGGGVNRYAPETESMQYYNKSGSGEYFIPSNELMALKEGTDGKIWMGSFHDGVIIYDPVARTFKQLKEKPGDPNALRHNNVMSLLEDPAGYWWIGTGAKGIDYFDLKIGSFKAYPVGEDSLSLSKGSVQSIVRDRKGRILAGTRGWGLNVLDEETGVINRYVHDPNNELSLSDNVVNQILCDSKGRVWVATDSGLNLFNPETGEFKSWKEEEGLSNKVVYQVLEDNQGRLWMSTNRGINRFDPSTEEVVVFDKSDGLLSSEYIWGAAHKGKSGKFYFGGTGGMDIFYPDSVKVNTTSSSTVITKFFYFNKELKTDVRYESSSKSSIAKRQLGEKEVYSLSRGIEFTEELVLDHTDYIFGFEFSLLNFKQPEKNQYAYRLKGYEEEWNYTDSKFRRATYTSIPYGDYTFEVKTASNSGSWDQEMASILITILPPWWLTSWAKTLWVIMVIGLLLTVYLSRVNSLKRIQKRLERRVDEKTRDLQQSNEKLKELNSFKESMTGMIAHDIKNPLSIILNNDDEKVNKEMAARILRLVNNMLDVHRFESTDAPLKLEAVDVIDLMHFVLPQVKPLVLEKNQRILQEFDAGQVEVDTEILARVLINLLTNAIKYSPTNSAIEIKVTQQNDEMIFLIKDQGEGISEKDQKIIFESFGQADPRASGGVRSTGLGLTFVKMALEAHDSEIEVDSAVGEGTTFKFRLPLMKASDEKKQSSLKIDFSLLSDQDKKMISSQIGSLRQLNIHQIGEIESELKALKENENEKIRKWVEEVLNAAYNGNAVRYNELLDLDEGP